MFDELGSPAQLAALLEALGRDAATEEERTNLQRAAGVVRRSAPDDVRAALTGGISAIVRATSAVETQPGSVSGAPAGSPGRDSSCRASSNSEALAGEESGARDPRQADIPREHSDLFGKGDRESLAALELRDAQPRRLDNLIALICDFDRKIEHTTGWSSWAHCTRSPANPPSGVGGRPYRRKHGGFGLRPGAPSGGRTRSPLPRRGGPLDRRDRPPARTRRSHGQGLPVRPIGC